MPSGQVEVITFENSQLPCLGEQLWNICVTDDHVHGHGMDMFSLLLNLNKNNLTVPQVEY